MLENDHICLVAMIFIVKGVSFINSQSLKIGGKIIFPSEFMPLGKEGFQIENQSIVTQHGQPAPFTWLQIRKPLYLGHFSRSWGRIPNSRQSLVP